MRDWFIEPERKPRHVAPVDTSSMGPSRTFEEYMRRVEHEHVVEPYAILVADPKGRPYVFRCRGCSKLFAGNIFLDTLSELEGEIVVVQVVGHLAFMCAKDRLEEASKLLKIQYDPTSPST